MVVEFDVTDVDEYKIAKRLGKACKKTPNVLAKAINFTIYDMRDLLQKRIQETYTIKSTGFRKAWKKNEVYKATPTDPVAVIKIKGNRLSLTNFILDPNKRPRVQPEYYRGKFMAKAAIHNLVANNGNKGFFATMPNGHSGIFYRISKSYESRKLAEITAPSLPQMAKDEKNVYNIVQPKIHTMLEENITKLIKRELEKNE